MGFQILKLALIHIKTIQSRNWQLLTLEEWRNWLDVTAHIFTGYTDYKNLKYLQTTKCLNPHQARWALNFLISSHPGSKNTKVYALSRLEDDREQRTEPMAAPEDKPESMSAAEPMTLAEEHTTQTVSKSEPMAATVLKSELTAASASKPAPIAVLASKPEPTDVPASKSMPTATTESKPE